MSKNHISQQWLGDVKVYVHYDYSPAEPERWNGLTGEGDPGCPACIEITSCSIGGAEFDPDCISAEILAEWEESIAEEMCSDAAAADRGEE